MFTSKIKLLFILFLSISFIAKAENSRGDLMFTAWLTGAEEVPEVNTNAKGVFSLRLTENHDSLIILGLVTGLSSKITGAAIQESRRGTTGGALKSLELLQAGNKFYGVITGTDLTVALIAKMLDGEAYVNILTTENPNGEIRGQIGLESDYEMYAVLNGAQMVPDVSTNAYGIAAFRLSHNKSKLEINAVFQGISNITDVKLVMGKIGVNGSNVMDLMPYLKGNKIDTNISVTGFPLLLTDSLTDDNIYIVVSSNAFPNGEIRGQLNRQYGLSFMARLDSEQETETVNSNGEGLGIFMLNKTLDTLTYDITFNNLSGKANSAHLHIGKPGVSGGVILDLSDSISGNRIMGKAYGTNITKGLIKEIIIGDVYVNVHTANYPKGEIRGQLISPLRETYAFDLCGQQETPIVNTQAQGVGIVSIDKDNTNMHYEIVADSLSSAITGAHFHKAAIKQTGGVILPITMTNNSAYGYWDETLTPEFTAAIAKDIAEGNVYANIHTENNKNGEIRGQVINGLLCQQIVSVAGNTIPATEIYIYPMPFSYHLTVEINTLQTGNINAAIFDMQGKEVQNTFTYIYSGKNTLGFDTKNMKPGLYMLKITDSTGKSFQKRIMKY